VPSSRFERPARKLPDSRLESLSAVHTETGRETSGPAWVAALALARFLFPARCLACRERSVERLWQGGVCRDCWQAVSAAPPHRCAVCDEPLPEETAAVCGRCLLAPPPFAALCAAAPYRGAAREILLAFKFRGADYLARHLAALMIRRLAPPGGVREVAAVPCTRRKRRGGDHAAELLGAAVAAQLRLPFAAERIEKTRETERQSRLPLSQRESNVRGAFRARGDCRGAILLVDDVTTSGATARECAGRLRDAGAQSVLVWCFARASRGDVDLEPSRSAADPR
jgi:predicted amidophosphoribosyltransferase